MSAYQWQAKTLSGFGAAIHVMEGPRSITDEIDKDGYPIAAKGRSLCGLQVQVVPSGITASSWTPDLCSRCAKKAGWR